MTTTLALVSFVAGHFQVACASKSSTVEQTDAAPEAQAAADDGGCPNDLPPACPVEVPSYKTDVSVILEKTCLGCHAPYGQEASHDFSKYASVFGYRSAILDQFYACQMPPREKTQPTPAERAKLLAWLVCGAPDN